MQVFGSLARVEPPAAQLGAGKRLTRYRVQVAINRRFLLIDESVSGNPDEIASRYWYKEILHDGYKTSANAAHSKGQRVSLVVLAPSGKTVRQYPLPGGGIPKDYVADYTLSGVKESALGETEVEVKSNTSTIDTLAWLGRIGGTVSGAYHGYKRNNESIGWGIGWALLGNIFWPVTIPVSLAQGFGKPAKKDE